jgi:hypothetical protein
VAPQTPGDRPAHRLGEAEVEHLGEAAPRHEDVGGLDVAMDHPGFVGSSERVGDLDPDGEQLAERQRTGGQAIAQCRPLEQLHGDEVLAVLLVDVVDRADARVVERRRRARLPAQPLERHRVGAQLGRQELQGDLATEPLVLGPIHHAHAARAQPRQDAVMRNGLSLHRRLPLGEPGTVGIGTGGQRASATVRPAAPQPERSRRRSASRRVEWPPVGTTGGLGYRGRTRQAGRRASVSTRSARF